MNYHKDFLKEQHKSKLRIGIGLAFLLVAIAWIGMKLMEQDAIEAFDWFYSGIFALNALFHILGGLGIPIQKLFGSAFIEIDETCMRIKLEVYKKEQLVRWEDIRSIDYNNNCIRISTDKESIEMALSKLDYGSVQEVKKAINLYTNPNH